MFCTSQLVKFKGDVVGTNLCKPSAIQYCSWCTVFVDRVSPNSLYLAFSTLITLTHGSGNHYGVSANGWVMLFSWCIQNLGNNHKENSGTPLDSLYSGPEPKLHWSSHRNTDILGLLELMSTESQCGRNKRAASTGKESLVEFGDSRFPSITGICLCIPS